MDQFGIVCMNQRLWILLAAAAGIAIVIFVPVGELFLGLVSWIEENRAFAWPIYVVVYVVATVLLLPGSILTLAAGFVFGLPIGVALVSLSSVLGACCAFLTGRYFARDWVASRIAGLPRFNALDRATGKDGFLIVLLVRLTPLFPFNLTNYGLGLTRVTFRDYLIASWVGMLPGTVLYVYLGSLAMNITELASGGGAASFDAGPWVFGTGLVAAILLSVVITRRANALLRKQLDSEEGTQD
jgi:uncharacterized membrane protein YdjX (TVP38/TMEM64 family)